LEDYTFFSFVIDTYEERIPQREKTKTTEEVPTSSVHVARGRPRNGRSTYLAEHSRHLTHRRVIRPAGHSTLPDIVGPFFPNRERDDPSAENLYFASMLSLLCPWRNLKDIKGQHEDFQSAYDAFLVMASPNDLDVISGIQYYHDCKNAA
ncbi:hypothetical protein EV363DRAFT_1146550, partial [Boletus edulis]